MHLLVTDNDVLALQEDDASDVSGGQEQAIREPETYKPGPRLRLPAFKKHKAVPQVLYC